MINAVYTEIVDPSAKYYYLLNRAINPRFTRFDLEHLPHEMRNYDKSIPFEDFFSSMDSDTVTKDWEGYDFDKAKVVERKDLPKYLEWSQVRILRYYVYKDLKDTAFNKQVATNGDIIVWIEKGMSKKKINLQEEKAIARYNNRPKEEKEYYVFSKPIYSKNREYVMISLDKSYSGCTHVFKLVNGSWKRIFSGPRWIA
ncbi:MAG: hypothetical protein ABIN95_13885 [Mucilaginibacter sp.]